MGQKSSSCRHKKLHADDSDDELIDLSSAKSWISGRTKAREPKRRKVRRWPKWLRLLRLTDSHKSSYSCSSNKVQRGLAPATFGREVYLRRLGINRLNDLQRSQTLSTREAAKSITLSRLDLQCDVSAEVESTHGQAALDLPCSSEFRDSYMSMNSCADTHSLLVKTPDSFIDRGSQDSQARLKFLQKLSYQRIWIPKSQRPPSHQTLIIFDWDDTLLCTSYLREFGRCGLELLPLDIRQTLIEAGEAAAKLLDLASSLGQTFIITNAVHGWVEQSASYWAPCLLPALQKVRIVSARSRYEAEYPDDVSKWKAATFLEVRRCLDSQVITNLISLGDSEYEMEATQTMGREFQQATIKLLKFNPCPYPEDLLKQLLLVTKEFEQIVGSGSNISIKLERCDD